MRTAKGVHLISTTTRPPSGCGPEFFTLRRLASLPVCTRLEYARQELYKEDCSLGKSGGGDSNPLSRADGSLLQVASGHRGDIFTYFKDPKQQSQELNESSRDKDLPGS